MDGVNEVFVGEFKRRSRAASVKTRLPRMRYRSFHERLLNAVLGTPGDAPESLRRAVLERARETPGGKDGLPADVSRYVDTVVRHAYRVTDAQVAELRTGHSDDELFEITVAAAVGAAMHRLDRGMAALRGEESD